MALPIIRRVNHAPTAPLEATIEHEGIERTSVVQLHDSEEVLCSVPKAFTLTDDDHKPTKYPVGTYMIPREHAMHWYAKANGVTIANTRNPNAV